MIRKYWTPEELEFLTLNYPTKGVDYCMQHLNRERKAVTLKANRLDLKVQNYTSKFKRTNEQYDLDLFEKEIDVIAIEDYIDNKTAILHECVEGHQWRARPLDILHGSACPSCANYGFNLEKPGIVYHVSFEYEGIEYYKLGITNRTVQQRFAADWKKCNMKIIWIKEFERGQDARNLEKSLLNKYSNYLINTGGLISGNSETLTVKVSE